MVSVWAFWGGARVGARAGASVGQGPPRTRTSATLFLSPLLLPLSPWPPLVGRDPVRKPQMPPTNVPCPPTPDRSRCPSSKQVFRCQTAPAQNGRTSFPLLAGPRTPSSPFSARWRRGAPRRSFTSAFDRPDSACGPQKNYFVVGTCAAPLCKECDSSSFDDCSGCGHTPH